ncbi:MAG: sulfurtransferase, partial [Acidimicrobiia bacterium]|nr:sulfurtransferase [Acidimicrobiia bacterium]
MPESLVTTQWLEDNLGNPNVVIIEVDEDVEAYNRDHIPGAIAWNWSTDLHHPLQRDYLDQDGFSDLLAAAGVNDGSTVALYGGNSNWFAAYAYWLLKYRGFTNVSLVDGGRLKWKIEERPLTSDIPSPTATAFKIGGGERPELRAFRDDVIAAIGASQFVDVRSPEEFSGAKLAPDHLPQ